jgi:gluconolactonase
MMCRVQTRLAFAGVELLVILLGTLGATACSRERSEFPVTVHTEVVRLDPAMDTIVPLTATLELLAEGFLLTEGPVWRGDGHLLFSDLEGDLIYTWRPDRWVPSGIVGSLMPDGLYTWMKKRRISEYRVRNGYIRKKRPAYSFPNGLALDKEGRLTMCEHGHRRVTRLEKDGSVTVLADRYEGHRLNSPNDLVYRSDGSLYFTDPPFGLPQTFHDSGKELPFSGVFSLSQGKLRLLSVDLSGPNGLAFSPDEKYLYVTNSDADQRVVMRYDANADGTLSNGIVFYDMTFAPGRGGLDGMKIDQHGNLYVTGPGGIWVLSPNGKHLGTIKGPKQPANIAWGDDDGKTLFLTAQTELQRIRLNVAGVRAGAP